MHPIQKHILKSLTVGGRARYRDLKPTGVEGNLFTYHMNALVEKEFVAKEGSQYKLTARGKRFADKVSLESFTERVQPKIVTMVYAENSAGGVLLYKRHREPFRGMWSLPYGKIHLGEKLKEAARRELSEKTGLSAELIHRGEIYLAVFEGDDLVTHMLAHIFEAKKPAGTLKYETTIGECAWMNPKKISDGDVMPGLEKILALLRTSKKNLFFEEYFVKL